MKYAITETGYHSALNNPPNKHKPTSQQAEAIYMPRLYLDYFRAGILRSYKYQFLDDRTEEEALRRGQPVQEAHFGYVDYELQPKPAYHAVKNLLTILQDQPAKAFRPQSLKYTVLGPKDEMRHLLLQKMNGDFYLAVWRAVSVWNESTREESPVELRGVTVELDHPAKAVRTFSPNRSAASLETHHDVRVLPLQLGAEVLILEIRLALSAGKGNNE